MKRITLMLTLVFSVSTFAKDNFLEKQDEIYNQVVDQYISKIEGTDSPDELIKVVRANRSTKRKIYNNNFEVAKSTYIEDLKKLKDSMRFRMRLSCAIWRANRGRSNWTLSIVIPALIIDVVTYPITYVLDMLTLPIAGILHQIPGVENKCSGNDY